MTSIAEQERRDEASMWRRWMRGWDLLIYAMLLLGLGVALPGARGGAGEAILILTLTGAFAFWYGYLGGVRKVWMRGTAAAASFLAVEAGLWLSLILLDPIFVFSGFALLAHVCVLNLSWSIVVAAIFGTGLFLEEALDPGPMDPSVLISALVTSTVVVLLNYLFHDISRRSEERRRLIGELEETRADLAAAEREEGMLAERHRLARDIHDTLAQGFTSIVMLLEAAEAELVADPGKARIHIDQARSTARGSLAEARSLVWALRPDRLIGSSLVEALQSVVDQLGEETSTRTELVVTGEQRQLPPTTDECILRVTQEALANVRKHADASRVSVTLSYFDDGVVLDVRDDGVGFEPAVLAATGDGLVGGVGLQLMLERVEQLGGTRVIESSAGEGTSVVVQLPAPLTVSPRSAGVVEVS
ncbi:MAG: sensor histidine kinase [Acidobacteria bacterium]|nr:sensor histidine kinase [Acidobacteriota bacterium]